MQLMDSSFQQARPARFYIYMIETGEHTGRSLSIAIFSRTIRDGLSSGSDDFDTRGWRYLKGCRGFSASEFLRAVQADA
jgi:hypothetical protein